MTEKGCFLLTSWLLHRLLLNLITWLDWNDAIWYNEDENMMRRDTVKKQKCTDFSIGATQKDSHSEPKISIFPPNLRVRRTCTSTYKWVDALEVDAGMPQNQFEYNMDIRKKQVLRQLFSFLFVPGAAPAW